MTAAGPPASSHPIPPPAAGEDRRPGRGGRPELELDREQPGARPQGEQHHRLHGDQRRRHREPSGRHDERGQGVLEPRVGVGDVGVDAARRVPAHQLADPALVPEDVGGAGRVVVAGDEPGRSRDDAGRPRRSRPPAGRDPARMKRRSPRQEDGDAATTSARSAHGAPTIETPASGWSIRSQAAPARHRMPTPSRSAVARPENRRAARPGQGDDAATAARRRRPLRGRPSSSAILGWSDARA